MEDANVTTVQIFGRDYKIKGRADKAYIEEMAGYVDKKMRELAANPSAPPQDKIAVLAALNIADELLQERNKNCEAFSSVEERTNRLIGLLEQSLLAEK